MSAYEVATHADGFGNWHATVTFPHTLSESDPRPEFNLNSQWPRIRRLARRAVVREVRSRQSAPARVDRLVVTDQGIIPGTGLWRSITIGEPRD